MWLLLILMTGGIGWLVYVFTHALKPRVSRSAEYADECAVPSEAEDREDTENVADEVAENPYAAPRGLASGGVIRAPRNWRDYSPEYNTELWMSARLQAFLGVLTALILDGGVAFRTFLVAALGYWLIVAILLIRRPMTPTWFDLQLVRWGILPFFLIVALAGPVLLRVTGLYP